MSTGTKSNVKASYTETHLNNKINDVIKEHVLKEQSSLVLCMMDSGFINDDDAINTQYIMYQNDEIPSCLIEEKLTQLKEDREEIQTQIYQCDNDRSSTEEHIHYEDSEDSEGRITQLNEDVEKLRLQIEELENKESEIDDKIYEMDSASIESYKTENWYLVSDWLITKLKEHNQIVLTTEYGTWWGAKPHVEELENNEFFVRLKEEFSGK